MANRGFISLVALAWFSFCLAFINGALVIMNNYLSALKNLQVAEKELTVEKIAVAQAHRMFSDMSEEDYCDYVGDYEVCWAFGKDRVSIIIDYQDYIKTLRLSYDWDTDSFSELRAEVDK